MVDLVQLHPRRVGVASVSAWLAWLACAAACSSSQGEPTASATASDAEAAPLDAGAVEGGARRLDTFTVTTDPDTPCSAASASRVLVYPKEFGTLLTDLGPAGARWIASAIGDEGFVTFDGDGKNPSASPIGPGFVNRAAGGAKTIALASATASGIQLAKFDVHGLALGNASTLSNDSALSLALGRSGERTLVAWSTGSHVRARAANADGAPEGEAFDLETAVDHDSFSASVAPHGASDFAIAWSERRHRGDAWRVYLAFAKAGKVDGLVHLLFEASAPVSVGKLVTSSEGYALAVNANVTSARADAVVIPLNAFGQLAGPAHKFAGSSYAYGIAAYGKTLGLLARKNGADAFRPLDALGAASGPWVCLDAETPNRDQSASLTNDDAGFAALYRDPDGATYFARLAANAASR